MSIDTCACGQYVDTDFDTGCYHQEFPDGSEMQLNHCRCENCRDEVYELAEATA